jgi:hypothetical protein
MQIMHVMHHAHGVGSFAGLLSWRRFLADFRFGGLGQFVFKLPGQLGPLTLFLLL